jgi:hypothetical protein
MCGAACADCFAEVVVLVPRDVGSSGRSQIEDELGIRSTTRTFEVASHEAAKVFRE